jgi:hypothetical protein
MDKELELHLAKAAAADESIKSFTETIGNIPTPWEKGDVITFPAKIIGNSFKTKIGAKKYEYIVVTVTGADGSKRYANFFPSLFRRRARVCELDVKDGVEIAVPTNEFVVAGGSIVDKLYAKRSKVNDVVTAILGKSIKISEVHEVETQKYGSNEPDTAKVYDFEPEGWSLDAPAAADADAENGAEA